jgi:hypothetical protein
MIDNAYVPVSPEDAGAKLDALTAAYRGAPSKYPKDPKTPTEAAGRLNELKSIDGWTKLYLAGSGPHVAEFNKLQEIASSGAAEADPVKAVMSGNVPEMASSEIRLMEHTASTLREIGIRDSIIKDVIAGTHEVTKEEWDLTVQWKKDHMENPEWVKALLGGNAKERRELALATIILTGGIRKEKRAS